MIRVIQLLVLATGLICAAAFQSAGAETRFLSTIQDMPLAPGLEERADDAYVFVAPEGRITQVEAVGATGEAPIGAYYRLALPSLGWALQQEGAQLAFVRGRERLELRFDRAETGETLVRYRLIARPASLALD